MCNNLFWWTRVCFASFQLLITLKEYGIFGSKFAYLFILTLYSHYLQNGDEALPSIILASRDNLVKMLTLEPHNKIWSNIAYLYFFLKNGMETDKEKKKKIDTAGFEPLCVRLLDNKNVS